MSGKRILDIELLRGLAVLGVVFHHLHGNLFSGSPALLDGINQRVQFWWGVDLFFAISGFVIARTLIPQLREAPTRQAFWEQARYFWIRRAFRLLPSAWLWLALILACCLLLNRSGAFGSLSANLAASLAGFLQVANFRFADSFYRYEYGASFVYWSLSLEEQFYLLLPLLILCLRRYLGWALLALVLVQFFSLRTPLLMVLRTDALAIGVLLALASLQPGYARWNPTLLGRAWSGPLLLVAVAAALGVLASEAYSLVAVRIGAIALLCGLLVWIASYDRDYLLSNGPLKRLLVWVGARSYAIYLIHIPAFYLSRELCFRLGWDAGERPLSLLGTSLVLIVVLSELNYRFVESPCRDLGSRLVKRLSAARRVAQPVHARVARRGAQRLVQPGDRRAVQRLSDFRRGHRARRGVRRRRQRSFLRHARRSHHHRRHRRGKDRQDPRAPGRYPGPRTGMPGQRLRPVAPG